MTSSSKYLTIFPRFLKAAEVLIEMIELPGLDVADLLQFLDTIADGSITVLLTLLHMVFL